MTSFFKKHKILIVEDEPAIADNIQYALETEGFETVCYHFGGEVLDFIKREQVDLIILDIGLPDINGLELFKDIKKFGDLPIIFLTARAQEIDRVLGLELGADDYVTKPFSPRELTARVKAVLRRTGQQENNAESAAASLKTQIFEVDEDRCKIHYDKQELPLSRYEYLILKTFISRPGHVFSRERLMDVVWDEPEVSMDRTVDAHIKNIRSKLKKIKPDFDPIVTHRSMGYSLREDI